MTDEMEQRRQQAELHLRRHSDYDCGNQLTMVGPEDDVNAAMDFVANGYGELNFNQVLPVPDEIKVFNPLNIKPSVLDKYKALDAYSYRDEHWSTSKEPRNVRVQSFGLNSDNAEKFSTMTQNRVKIEKITTYLFDTCLTPPSGIYFALSKKFPSILFHYTFDIKSEATSSCGWALGMGGKILNRAQYDDSFANISLHLNGFSELWLDQLDGDNDNDEE